MFDSFPVSHTHPLRLFLLLVTRFDIGLNEELRKEHKETENVDNVTRHHTETGGFALRGQEVRSLRHHGDELDHLHHGQTGFPPNGQRLSSFWYFGVHANEIVRVHDGVNESIQEDRQVHITIVVDVRVEPIKEKDGNVMVDVQEAQLTPLLSRDNKDGIPKIPDFGNVKEPQQVGDGWTHLLVPNTGHDGVPISVGEKERFEGHVRTQHDL